MALRVSGRGGEGYAAGRAPQQVAVPPGQIAFRFPQHQPGDQGDQTCPRDRAAAGTRARGDLWGGYGRVILREDWTSTSMGLSLLGTDIDPVGAGSALALVRGVLGLLERRRRLSV